MTNNNLQEQLGLKERFLILHDYARLMFLTDDGLRDCTNDDVYSSRNTKCLNCDLKTECKCLSEKETENIIYEDLIHLIEKMKVAKNYVERKALHNIQEHGACGCDSCVWLAEFDKTQADVFKLLSKGITEASS